MNIQLFMLAKKYARAFTNIFIDKLNFDEIKKLEEFISFINQHKQTLFYLKLSFKKDEDAQLILWKLIEQFDINIIFKKLVDLLIADKRISLLPMVFDYIIKIYKERYNIMNFTIVSSHKLNEDKIKVIQDFLVRNTGKTIIYTVKIDKRLIAGLKLYSHTLGWEHSVSQQLIALSQAR